MICPTQPLKVLGLQAFYYLCACPNTNVVAPVDVCLNPEVGKFGRWKLLSISFLIAWHMEDKILALAFHCEHPVYSMVMGLTTKFT